MHLVGEDPADKTSNGLWASNHAGSHREVADMKYRLSGRRCQDLARDAEDKEWVAMQRQAAANWRADNADALRRFELA